MRCAKCGQAHGRRTDSSAGCQRCGAAASNLTLIGHAASPEELQLVVQKANIPPDIAAELEQLMKKEPNNSSVSDPRTLAPELVERVLQAAADEEGQLKLDDVRRALRAVGITTLEPTALVEFAESSGLLIRRGPNAWAHFE